MIGLCPFKRNLAAAFCAVGVVSCDKAWASPNISIAAIISNRLLILGNTQEPRTKVVLDRRFETISDESGDFEFELAYHPESCLVSAVINETLFRATVSNCRENEAGSKLGKAATFGAQGSPAETAAATSRSTTPSLRRDEEAKGHPSSDGQTKHIHTMAAQMPQVGHGVAAPPTAKQMDTAPGKPPPVSRRDLSSVQIAAYKSKGRDLIRAGNIAAARALFESAAESNDPEALLLLGETYDPRLLASWGIIGVQADPASAQRFYARAADHGVVAARDRLLALRN